VTQKSSLAIERIQNEKVVKFCSISRACRVRAGPCAVTLTCSFLAEAMQLQGRAESAVHGEVHANDPD
jgi:hypothetical protein